MVSALKAQGLLDSTLIIITAKHGQSPIDPHRFQEVNSGITTTPADVIAGFLLLLPRRRIPPHHRRWNRRIRGRPSGPTLDPIGPTLDDVSLLWLAPGRA